MIRCNGGSCIHPNQLCDGLKDCPKHGEDERHCPPEPCLPFCTCYPAFIVCCDAPGLEVFDAHGAKNVVIRGKLPEVPRFKHTDNFHRLDLSHNTIADVPSTMSHIPTLAILDLSSNKIAHIVIQAFMGMLNIRVIFSKG